MDTRLAFSQVFKDLLAGPAKSPPPSAYQVASAAEAHPRQFAVVMRKLFSAMASEVLRFPRRDSIGRWVRFSNVWRGTPSTDEAKYYFASLDAYERAVRFGLRELDWRNAHLARAVATNMSIDLPNENTIEGLAWRALLGQVESIYSRGQAANTFREVRGHSQSSLMTDFSRDTGALTYYSEDEIRQRRNDVPSLQELRSWETRSEPLSKQAILISADSTFFRIYAPMILHNAQQLPKLDFVILLCAPPTDAAALREDAEVYLSGLANLNKQPAPSNVRLIAVPTPEWVVNEITFYATSRFLAIPSLLEQYCQVYAMDADLFMLRDPRPFMEKSYSSYFGAPRTEGSLGVSPWRRYMAGNVVANRDYLGSTTLTRLHDYLSVGLTEESSWMLDQNALTYAIEGMAGFKPLAPRPTSVGSFMSQWEKNFRTSSKR